MILSFAESSGGIGIQDSGTVIVTQWNPLALIEDPIAVVQDSLTKIKIPMNFAQLELLLSGLLSTGFGRTGGATRRRRSSGLGPSEAKHRQTDP